MTKYGNKKTCYDGITFDSKLECLFYIDLLEAIKSNKIKRFELQPQFVLQDKFEKNGKKYRPILYKADFRIFFNDGTSCIIDCKGMETIEFKLKKKLFVYKYDEPLYCMTHIKKYGGWIELEQLKRLRRQNTKKIMTKK